MRILLALLVLCLAIPAHALTIPEGELPDDARPIAYRLTFDVDPAQPRFSGTTEIDIETTQPLDRLFLHGNGLDVSHAEARTGGRSMPARYRQRNSTGTAELRFARPLPAGRHTLVLRYRAPFMEAAQGLYRAEAGGRPYAFTQFQAIDARRAFPGFDEPRHKTPFEIAVVAPAGMKAFANAPEIAAEPMPGRRIRHRFASTMRLPTYLVSIAVGDFDVVEGVAPPNSVRKEPLPLRGIATKGQGPRLATAMAETPKLLTLVEEWTGIPLPLPKLDVIASPIHGGAMENSGLIIFDDTILLFEADAPPAQLIRFGVVMAHELAHEWFGNAITPRWWDDLWLNESFATWMGEEIAARWREDLGIRLSGTVRALGAMDLDSLPEGRPIRQPIVQDVEVESAFDAITYAKGGQVLRMLLSYLGEERFQEGIRLHLRRHWMGTASSEDFFRNMAEAANDPDLVASLRSFTDQRGVPLIRFAEAPGGSFALQQAPFRPLGFASDAQTRWVVPVCAQSGEGRQCTLLRADRGALPAVIGTEPWVTGNADGAGYYRFDLPDDAWQRLLAAAEGLPDTVALTAADSLWAGMLSGARRPTAVLEGARAFAGHDERLVATFLPGRVADLVSRMGDAGDRQAARAFVKALAAPRLEALGLDPARGAYSSEPADRQQLRQALVQLVVETGMAEAPSALLADAARRAVAGDDRALDAAFRVPALRAALRADPAFEGQLFKALAASDDTIFRRAAAEALAAEAGDAALARFDDPALSSREALILLSRQFAESERRGPAFDWMMANLDRVRPKAGGLLGGFLGVLSGFCSAEDAARIDAALRPRLDALGAAPLDLDRPLAAIRTCAAQQDVFGQELSRAIAAAVR
jgi:aminopeptidase N